MSTQPFLPHFLWDATVFDITEYGIKEAYFLGQTYEQVTTEAFCHLLRVCDAKVTKSNEINT